MPTDFPPRTYAWACATDGRLTDPEKKLVRRAILASYAEIGAGLVRWPFRRSTTDGSLPAAPDSRLARQAEEAALEQGPALTGHGYRTWAIGTVLARADQVSVDAELLYVTSLLHDAGMAREVVGQDFTVRSGAILIDVFAKAGEDAATGQRAADAAVAHAGPGLTAAMDPIGYYVQTGAMADLAGLRMWDLPRGVIAEAYRAYPAHDIHRVIPNLVRQESKNVPDGRFARLQHSGLDRLVRLSPTRRYARM